MKKINLLIFMIVISISLAGCKIGKQIDDNKTTTQKEITQTGIVDIKNSKDIKATSNNKDQNEDRDITPICLYYPDIYEPPHIGIVVERQTSKMPFEGFQQDVWPDESEENYQKIEDTIFTAHIISNDELGKKVPVFFEMDEKEDIKTEAEIIGVIKYKNSEYSVAELEYTTSGGYNLKFRIFIPRDGEDYWVVVWNSREIIQTQYPKYLIHEKYLENISEN